MVEALLTPDPTTEATTAVRTGGTTRFAEGAVGDALPTVTPDALRSDYPSFANLRLVKSDTDGYDVALVPAIAEAWGGAHPVLFFEYDHRLSRHRRQRPARGVAAARELGYRDVAVWGNGGQPLGRTTVDDIGARTAPLEEKVGIRAADLLGRRRRPPGRRSRAGRRRAAGAREQVALTGAPRPSASGVRRLRALSPGALRVVDPLVGLREDRLRLGLGVVAPGGRLLGQQLRAALDALPVLA